MENTLYYGDNIEILKQLSKDNSKGFIDLVYIDPPFNSNRNYSILFEDLIASKDEDKKHTALKEAFKDTWSNIDLTSELEEMKDYTDKPLIYQFLSRNKDVFTLSQMSYLTMMAHRIYYIHKVLKDSGSIYLHCDPTAGHYLKILLDIIFGEKNFRNEIIWAYHGPGSPNMKQFNRKHDTIFWYSKGNNWCFNADNVRIPYKKAKQGLVNRMSASNLYTEEDVDYYNNRGKVPETWWEIRIAARSKNEYLGYPTQKPEALLERIIKASSNEGDIVADFFCGCGTTITVAEKLNRKWLGVDINHLAISLVEEKRLKPLGSKYKVIGVPQDLASAEKLANDNKFAFEEWIVEYIFKGHKTKKTGDGGIDGHITYTDLANKKFQAIIEVKGGNVNITQIRAFKDSIIKFNTEFGIFVAFNKYITDGMRREANDLGEVQMGMYAIKKMTIITIEDIFANDLPDAIKHLNKNITY